VELHYKNYLIERIPTLKKIFLRCSSELNSRDRMELLPSNFFLEAATEWILLSQAKKQNAFLNKCFFLWRLVVSFSVFKNINWRNFINEPFVRLNEPKSSIAVCFKLFYISSLFGNVYFATSAFYSKVNNNNCCGLSWCCFSSHFVVSRYPRGLDCFDDDLSVDKPKNRSVANIVVSLFEALYILQLTDTVAADFSIWRPTIYFPLPVEEPNIKTAYVSLEKMPLFYRLTFGTK